ncbi:unnamed protein product [Sphagnum jensenii]|uniref:Uncharacterized protein n=1 Tax=Sphagnum jensenii TaxID=128206 RepID=A0ABP1A5K7_9BRYO
MAMLQIGGLIADVCGCTTNSQLELNQKECFPPICTCLHTMVSWGGIADIWALIAEAIVKISLHHITSLFSIPSALIVCSLLRKHVNGVIGAICRKLLILNQSLEVMSASRKAHIEVRKLLYESQMFNAEQYGVWMR